MFPSSHPILDSSLCSVNNCVGYINFISYKSEFRLGRRRGIQHKFWFYLFCISVSFNQSCLVWTGYLDWNSWLGWWSHILHQLSFGKWPLGLCAFNHFLSNVCMCRPMVHTFSNLLIMIIFLICCLFIPFIVFFYFKVVFHRGSDLSFNCARWVELRWENVFPCKRSDVLKLK